MLAKVFLGDSWAGNDGLGKGVRLPFSERDSVMIGDQERLDIGLIRLGSNLEANLRAGKLTAIPESEWTRPAADDFDFYLLLGAPSETKTPGGTSDSFPSAYSVPRAVAQLRKTARTERMYKTEHRRFYGAFVNSEGGRHYKGIEGMSGGPIFGCNGTFDQFTSQIVAVQSGFDDEAKTVSADYLADVADQIKSRVAAITVDAGHSI